MRMDVLPSIITTCRFSGLYESLYLLKLMFTPAEEIASDSEKFTSYANKRHLDENPTDRSYCEQLLHTFEYESYVKPTTNFIRKGLTSP
jgi:hypothetical protein